MEILRESDELPRCPYRLPVCRAPKKGASNINMQDFRFWRRSLPDSLRTSLSETGYIINAWVDPETAELSIEFTGDTYSREHWPPSCITSNTKFVDKFSDLKTLDDALITKIWNNLIEFIGTLPQPGDHGYEAYMAIHDDYLHSVHAVRKAEDDLFRMKLANEDLSYEIQKLKQQLLEFASVKAQLAEVTTALKVVSGLNKN
jgi:hypothetical protein